MNAAGYHGDARVGVGCAITLRVVLWIKDGKDKRFKMVVHCGKRFLS